MTNPLVFVDTETTGLHHGRRVWEVAMIRVEPDSLDGSGRGTSFFIDADLSQADPAALAVGRFYDRHPKYAPPPASDPDRPLSAARTAVVESFAARAGLRTERQAALEVERWTRGAQLVGYNPGFDESALAAMLRHHGLAPAWHYHPIDGKALAAGALNAAAMIRAELAMALGEEAMQAFLRHPIAARAMLTAPMVDGPAWSTEGLSRALGVEPPPAGDRHTAMGDARWTQRLYNRITRGAAVPAVGGAS